MPIVTIETLSNMEYKIPFETDFVTVLDVKKWLIEKEGANESLVIVLEGLPLSDSTPVSFSNTFYWFHIEPVQMRVGCDNLVENAKNWESRNKIKSYLGVYLLYKRDFCTGLQFLRSSLSVYSSNSFFPYSTVVGYAILSGCMFLERKEMKEMLHTPEILESQSENKTLLSMLHSLYYCDYKTFFASLLDVMNSVVGKDWILSPHASYICKTLRARVYTQIFDSYCSISLDSLSSILGLSPLFIEREIEGFIGSGELSCFIDKKSCCVVLVPRADSLVIHNQIKTSGDFLLSRIKNLLGLLG